MRGARGRGCQGNGRPPKEPGLEVHTVGGSGRTPQAQRSFDEQGYVVVPRFAESAITQRLRLIAEEHLATELAPMEYEVDVQYPGAPADAEAQLREELGWSRRAFALAGKNIF